MNGGKSSFLLTLKFKPFLKLCIATFLVFNGFIMIAGFQSYVIIYYVFGGDAEQGAAFVGHSGLLQAVSGLAVIFSMPCCRSPHRGLPSGPLRATRSPRRKHTRCAPRSRNGAGAAESTNAQRGTGAVPHIRAPVVR